MIEIVFGEGACGSLKVAQGYGKGKYPGGAVSVFIRNTDGTAPAAEEIQAAQLRAEEEARGIGKMLFRWIAGETMCIVSTLL